MKTNLLLISLLLFGLTSCSTEDVFPTNLEAQIEGKWMMHQVFLKGNDVTQEHNPKKTRWVNFEEEGQYASGGIPYDKSTGNWNIDETQAILYLKSQTSEKSAWKITINGDELIWVGTGNALDSQLKLVLKRDWTNS